MPEGYSFRVRGEAPCAANSSAKERQFRTALMLADASLELQLLRDAQGYGVGFQQLSDTAVATPRAMSLLDAAAGLSLSEQSPLPSPKTASGVAAALEALAYSTVRWMPRTRAVGVDVRERRPSPLPDGRRGLRGAALAAHRHAASTGASFSAPEQCYGAMDSGCGRQFNGSRGSTIVLRRLRRGAP